MPREPGYEDVGACLFGDAMTVDDILLGTPARNPRSKPEPTMVIPWPVKIGYLRDKKTGDLVPYERFPGGLAFRTRLGRVPVRLKIYVDIGMLAIDRDIKTSCLWRTKFCAKHCYNRSLMQFRKGMEESGKPDEAFWAELDGDWLHAILHSDPFKAFCERMEKTPAWMRSRMRLATRGEAFAHPSDAAKVADLCAKNPATTFWVTTRAWVNDRMADLIQKLVMRQPNARVLASLDPSHSPSQFDRIERMGWNTIFFGDDTFTEGRFLCPKTWQKKIGYCRICQPGCFKNGSVDVHLAIHGTRVEESELREFRTR